MSFLGLIEKDRGIVMPWSEKERLVILIDHWIRHNREHTSEYLKVAERLESRGLSEIASSIRKASEVVLRANDDLSVTQERLTRMNGKIETKKEKILS